MDGSDLTALKATNLAEEHTLNIRGTEGIHPCESIHSSGQKSATLFTFQSITTGHVHKIITSLQYRVTKLPVAIK